MSRRVINPWQWQDDIGFVQGIELKGPQQLMLRAGQTAVDAEGKVKHIGDMLGQMNLALDNLEIVLAGSSMCLKDIVRLNYYTTDMDGFHQVSDALKERLVASECFATATLLGVNALAYPELLVEFEATAAVGGN